MIPLNVNLPLKTVTERIRSCGEVLWAIDTYGDRLVEGLGGEFAPLLAEGQVMPFATNLELFSKKLVVSRDRMVAADRAYRDQRTRETLFRGRRDQRAKAANAAVVGLRQAFAGIYSDEKLAEVGFARRTPQPPGELLEQATHLATHLSDPELDVTGARFDGVQLDPPKLAQELADAVDGLRLAADDLAREERKSEALKLAKDDALEAHNQYFVWIARTVESFCRLAGLEEVAKRIRPSGRRHGVTERLAEPPEDADSADEADQPSPEEDAPEVPQSS